MARVDLNSLIRHLRGRVGDVVIKHYKYGIVITNRPNMKGIKPSALQLAQRDRVTASAKLYHQVLKDPALNKRYAAIAKKKGLPLPSVVLAEYTKQSRKSERRTAAPKRSAAKR